MYTGRYRGLTKLPIRTGGVPSTSCTSGVRQRHAGTAGACLGEVQRYVGAKGTPRLDRLAATWQKTRAVPREVALSRRSCSSFVCPAPGFSVGYAPSTWIRTADQLFQQEFRRRSRLKRP